MCLSSKDHPNTETHALKPCGRSQKQRAPFTDVQHPNKSVYPHSPPPSKAFRKNDVDKDIIRGVRGCANNAIRQLQDSLRKITPNQLAVRDAQTEPALALRLRGLQQRVDLWKLPEHVRIEVT